MLLIIRDNQEAVGDWAAKYIAQRMNSHRPKGKGKFVLGLPTGSSPLPVYRRLIAMNKSGEVSFRQVVTFNMDEYVGIPANHPYSFHYFMNQNFFDHIDINRRNINFLNGNASDLREECDRYEKKIRQVGGITLFLAGVGIDGHLAFNEPGSSLSSRTRDKDLTYDTMVANARFFDNDPEKVPKKSLTVGVGTIMDAREVLVVVTGYAKARVLRNIVEEGVNHMWPGSMLQLHPRCVIVCDDDATMELKVGTVRYFKDIETHSDRAAKYSRRWR